MPIRWYQSAGAHRFSFFCDFCGQRIEKASDGIAIHFVTRTQAATSGESEASGPVPIVHRGDCDDQYTSKFGDGYGTTELDVMLVYLANNARIDWKEAINRATLLTELL